MRMFSTYPDSADEALRDQHRETVKAEREGKVRRHLDMEHNDQGPKYVIWVPVEDAADFDEGESPSAP